MKLYQGGRGLIQNGGDTFSEKLYQNCIGFVSPFSLLILLIFNTFLCLIQSVIQNYKKKYDFMGYGKTFLPAQWFGIG